MKSVLPKVLHQVHGMPLIQHVINQVLDFKIRKIIVVVGYGEAEVRKAVQGLDRRINFVRQNKQHGTGHAVFSAKNILGNRNGSVLVLAGDAPFLKKKTLSNFIKEHQLSRPDCSILTSMVNNPKGYGRIIRDLNGEVIGIREELDAADYERDIREINSGAYLFDIKKLFNALKKIKSSNKKGEYYLTDTIEVLIKGGRRVSAQCLASEDEVIGINSREDLVNANRSLNLQKVKELLEDGVTVFSPENTFIAKDVTVGEDSVIYPCVYIEKGVKIGKGCKIGPFAYIREGSRIEDRAQIGSFVEVVRSRVGKGTMIKHLSYVGDSRIGEGVNIGAGTITANYDGLNKHNTIIDDGAFIGSNTVLVAPVRVGRKAKTGAGSVVLAQRHVKSGDTVVGIPAKSVSILNGHTKKQGKRNEK